MSRSKSTNTNATSSFSSNSSTSKGSSTKGGSSSATGSSAASSTKGGSSSAAGSSAASSTKGGSSSAAGSSAASSTKGGSSSARKSSSKNRSATSSFKSSNASKSKSSNITSQTSSVTSVVSSKKGSGITNSSKSSKSSSTDAKSRSKWSGLKKSSYTIKSIEPSSLPHRPILSEKINEILKCKPYIEVDSMDEINKAGYSMGNFIVSDDCYQFFSATKNSNEDVLCKMVELEKCSPRYKENMKKYGLRIARYFGGLDGQEPICNNFIKIHEIFKVKNNIYVFMEECPNKSLYLTLLDKDNYSAIDERKWITQICKAIGKMQEYGVSHRFLKLQHILFDSKQNVKIAGWSKSVVFWDPKTETPLIQNKERKASKNNHLPPEAFRGPYDPTKADMWSLGVIMVCLNTRRYPFSPTAPAKFSAQWRQFVVKHEMNRYLRAACNKTFFIDPKRRATPTKFLEHPYFKTSEANITLKEYKTTVDPKYDPEMPDISTETISKAGFSSSAASSASSSANSSYISSNASSKGSSYISASSSNHSKNTSLKNALSGSKKSSAASSTSQKNSESKKSSEISKNSNSNTKSSCANTVINVSQNNFEEGSEIASGTEGGEVGKLVDNESYKQAISAPEEQQEKAEPISFSKKNY